MAEIKIEKKTPKWPWIILVLVIIGILIYFFAFDDDDDEAFEQTTEEPADTRPVALNNSTVMAFVRFIEEDPDSMGLDHEYTNEALLRLADATKAMADEIDYDIERDLEKVRQLSEKVATDPFETTHANSIKEAAEILAMSMQSMQRNYYRDLDNEASDVKKAAMEIETDVLTLDQKGDVKNFFNRSADLLKTMNNNSPEN